MIKAFVKYRLVYALLVILAIGLAIGQLHKLEINTDFSQFLPERDWELDFFNAWKADMGDDEDLLAIGVAAPKTVFDLSFLKMTKQFADSVRHLPQVRKVSSLITLSKPVKSPFGIVTFPYIRLDSVQTLSRDSIKVFRDFHWTCHFINKEANTLILYLNVEPGMDADQTTAFIQKLKVLRSNFPGLITHITGRKFYESEFKTILAGETNSFMLYVVGFILIVLLLIYRDAISVIFPLLLVVSALILFFGWMAAFGRPLNIMSNLFPTILLIVGVSDIIHLGGKYNTDRTRGINAYDACKNALREIGWITFLTSFTTAAGFLTLYLSSMKALRDFGLEAAFGVLLAFVITMLLAPAFFLLNKKGFPFRIRENFSRLTIRLFTFIEFLNYRYFRVITVFAVIAGLSAIAAFYINTNNRQLSNVPDNSDLKSSYGFFEERTGGARSFELALIAKDSFLLNNPQMLKAIKEVHLYLDSLPFLSNIQSPASIYHAAHRVHYPSDTSKMAIPTSGQTIRKYEKNLKKFPRATLLILNKEKTKGRIKARIKDLGRHDIEIKNQMVLNQLNTLLDTSMTSYNITGIDYLADKAHAARIKNMFQGLGIAIVVVALVMGFIYRSIALTLITLLLNLLPVLVVAGVMGVTGIELRGATSIVFTIGFVIAVDDTIHFIGKFQLERKKGLSIESALHATLFECGRAILVTSLVLMGGFALLMTSDFTEVFAHGLLVCIMVFVALLVDLILAPALMLSWFKKWI